MLLFHYAPGERCVRRCGFACAHSTHIHHTVSYLKRQESSAVRLYSSVHRVAVASNELKVESDPRSARERAEEAQSRGEHSSTGHSRARATYTLTHRGTGASLFVCSLARAGRLRTGTAPGWHHASQALPSRVSVDRRLLWGGSQTLHTRARREAESPQRHKARSRDQRPSVYPSPRSMVPVSSLSELRASQVGLGWDDPWGGME